GPYRERSAAGAVEDLDRGEPAAVDVDPGAQPLTDSPQPPGGEAAGGPAGEPAEGAASRLPELAGDHVAEAVGGEVPERTGGPVHVLEHSVGVVGGAQPEIGVIPRVPRLGKVAQLELAGEDLQLELEADQDVKVVGELVGLD